MQEPAGLPTLTHLQYLVITCTWHQEITAENLRHRMRDHGVTLVASGFVQLMRRLEKDKLVHGRYTRKMVGGMPKREKRYKAAARAMDLAMVSKNFYGSAF